MSEVSTQKQKNWFARHKIITGIIVIFVLAAVAGNSNSKTQSTQTVAPTPNNTNSPSPTSNPPVETIKISANELYNAYQNNEVGADQQYKDKILEVRGVVDSISKSIGDSMFVRLKTTNIIGSINCMLVDSEAQKAGSLTKGKAITVIGTDTGEILGSVDLSDCKIK